MAHPNDDTPRIPARTGMSRRRFLKAAGLTGAATVLLQQSGHDPQQQGPQLPTIPIVTPTPPVPNHQQRYDAAYRRLTDAIAPAAQELSDFAAQFTIFDTLVLLKGFDVTLVPACGHMEGVCQYRMRDHGDKRGGNLPAINRLLKACIEIQLLNEECPVEPRQQLDFNAIGNRVTAEFMRLNPHMKANPCIVQEECSAIFSRMTQECAPFLRKEGCDLPCDVAESRELPLLINGRVPLNVTVMNPTLKKSQDQAFALRSSAPHR